MQVVASLPAGKGGRPGRGTSGRVGRSYDIGGDVFCQAVALAQARQRYQWQRLVHIMNALPCADAASRVGGAEKYVPCAAGGSCEAELYGRASDSAKAVVVSRRVDEVPLPRWCTTRWVRGDEKGPVPVGSYAKSCVRARYRVDRVRTIDIGHLPFGSST